VRTPGVKRAGRTQANAEFIMKGMAGTQTHSLINTSRRIKRFFYYQYRGAATGWDSGLVEPGGEDPRTIYNLYKAKTG
jgi:hypothetical protein